MNTFEWTNITILVKYNQFISSSISLLIHDMFWILQWIHLIFPIFFSLWSLGCLCHNYHWNLEQDNIDIEVTTKQLKLKHKFISEIIGDIINVLIWIATLQVPALTTLNVILYDLTTFNVLLSHLTTFNVLVYKIKNFSVLVFYLTTFNVQVSDFTSLG